MVFNKSFDRVFKIRTLLYFFIPAILMIVIIFVNYELSKKNYCEMYKELYFKYFDEVFARDAQEVDSIVNMTHWLEDDNFYKVFNGNEPMSDNEVRMAIQRMNRLKNENNHIDSILIVNNKAECVISTSGKADINKYFKEMCVYKDYDALFFNNMRNPIGSVTHLPPTSLKTIDGTEKYVLPVVMVSLEDINSNNLLIINFDIGKMVSDNQSNRFTPNTSIYFVNKQMDWMYSSNNVEGDIHFDPDTYDRIMTGEYVNTEYCDATGQKYLLLSHTASPNIMEYAYVILVPMKDIDKSIMNNTLKIIIITIVMYLMLLIIILIIGNKFNTIFSNIINSLNLKNISDTRAILRMSDRIETEIQSMINENKHLKRDMSKLIYEVKEKRIADVVYNRKSVNNENNFKLFKYNFFIPTIVSVSVQGEINTDDYKLFCEKIYSTLEKYFSELYDTYIILETCEVLHMIMNVPQNISREDIQHNFDDVNRIVCKNSSKINLEMYIGDVCNNEEKLKESYNLLLIDKKNSEIEKVEKSQNIKSDKFIYTLSDSNAIVNNIISMNYDNVIKHIDKVIMDNILKDVSDENMKLLYMNIVHSIIVALKMKNFDIDTIFDGKNENEVYEDVLNKNEEGIGELILDLLEKLSRESYESERIDLADEILNYINLNYKDNTLGLDSVAEVFGTNAKYISKIIKKQKNILFHEYLSNLRISEAKRLIEKSDMSIEAIYHEVGYISRSTFIRAFKSIEGVTPITYRNSIKRI